MIDTFAEHEDLVGRRALQILGHPEQYLGLPPWEGTDTVLRLFRFVGLGSYTAWAAGNKRVSGYMVRRITWDRRPEVNITEPTLLASHGEVAASILGPQVEALHTLSIRPFLRTAALGLDGTTYGIDYGSFSCGASVHWWQEAPSEWDALSKWRHATVSVIEAALPSREY